MKILFKVLRYARNLWPYYTGIIIFSVLMSVTALATPFIIKSATDLIVATLQTGQSDIGAVLWLAVALFAVSSIQPS